MFKNKGNQFHSKSKYYNIQQSNYMKKNYRIIELLGAIRNVFTPLKLK